nr:acyl-CoA thioesterase [Snodgrassella sp. CFCC 13594]
MAELEFKKPTDSDVHLSVVMHPEDTNAAGNIFGGKILALMDQAAYACACKHARSSTVTASINTVNFRTPIYVGDLVTIKARVNYVGKTSMMVGIRVEAENLITGEVRHSNSSYFTMVAKGEDGKTKPVPGLILESSNQVRRFVRSYKRKMEQQESMKNFQAESFHLSKDHLDWCKQQNVLVDDKLYEQAES